MRIIKNTEEAKWYVYSARDYCSRSFMQRLLDDHFSNEIGRFLLVRINL